MGIPHHTNHSRNTANLPHCGRMRILKPTHYPQTDANKRHRNRTKYINTTHALKTQASYIAQHRHSITYPQPRNGCLPSICAFRHAITVILRPQPSKTRARAESLSHNATHETTSSMHQTVGNRTKPAALRHRANIGDRSRIPQEGRRRRNHLAASRHLRQNLVLEFADTHPKSAASGTRHIHPPSRNRLRRPYRRGAIPIRASARHSSSRHVYRIPTFTKHAAHGQTFGKNTRRSIRFRQSRQHTGHLSGTDPCGLCKNAPTVQGPSNLRFRNRSGRNPPPAGDGNQRDITDRCRINRAGITVCESEKRQWRRIVRAGSHDRMRIPGSHHSICYSESS